MKTYLNKINFIIGNTYRKKIIFLVVLLFIGMFFEILGLGSLLPVLSLIASPETLKEFSFFNDIIFLNTLTYNYLVLLLLICIGLIYLIKTLFLSYLTYRQNRFLANVTANISNNLFELYLSQSYDYHVNINSSKMLKNIQTEVNLLGAFNFAVISLFVELGLIFSILCTLIFIEPVGALSVSLFLGLLAYFFYRISKRKLSLWGQEREKADSFIAKTLLEGLNGIKDIKLLHVESFFTSKFNDKQNYKALITSNSNTLSQIPRYYLELISVLGLVLFIITMLLQNKDIPTLIATIGVFVAAVFRLIPSLNKILTAFQNIKFYSSSVDVIYNEFLSLRQKISKNNNHRNNKMKGNILIKDLSFSYNLKLKSVFEKINLEIKIGETIGIVGSSGQGKSTFVDLLNGLFKPSTGKILVNEIDIHNDIKSWNKKNNEHLLTLKQFLIENLKQSNKGLINNFKNLSNEIEKYNQEIAKEKDAYKDLNKKYSFINTIIKARGES